MDESLALWKDISKQCSLFQWIVKDRETELRSGLSSLSQNKLLQQILAYIYISKPFN